MARLTRFAKRESWSFEGCSLALLDRLNLGGGQRIDIDLQAHGQGGPRAHPLHEFMKFEHPSPEGFVTEGLEPEDLPPERLQIEQERAVDELNRRKYGRPQSWLPLPLAVRPPGPPSSSK